MSFQIVMPVGSDGLEGHLPATMEPFAVDRKISFQLVMSVWGDGLEGHLPPRPALRHLASGIRHLRGKSLNCPG